MKLLQSRTLFGGGDVSRYSLSYAFRGSRGTRARVRRSTGIEVVSHIIDGRLLAIEAAKGVAIGLRLGVALLVFDVSATAAPASQLAFGGSTIKASQPTIMMMPPMGTTSSSGCWPVNTMM